MMKRTLIAAAFVAGSIVPMVMATVFVFGCCVLPFHRVIHRVMPLCHTAMAFIGGGDRSDDAAQTPAREKQEPVKRLVTHVPVRAAIREVTTQARVIAPTPTNSYRSFISLGATRCDRDVGLHVVIRTFLI